MIDPSGLRASTRRRHPARRARLLTGMISASGLLGVTVALVATNGFHNTASATSPAAATGLSGQTTGPAGTSSGSSGFTAPGQVFSPPQAATFAPGGGAQTSSGGS